MKNYLKPYTACTKVESEGHLLAGSPKDTPNAGGGGFTGGTPGGGSGQIQNPPTTNPKTKSYAPYSVGNGISFNIQDGE